MDVTLRLVPPGDPGWVALHVYEAASAAGPWTEIERTTEIGAYPNYIDTFTTSEAVSRTDWFAIAWEDSTGALDSMSAGIQGGTTTVVGEIIDKVTQRDNSLSDDIVRQEAEAVVESYAGGDPYVVDPTTVSYRKMLGLVYLTLARCYVFAEVVGGEEGATIGVVKLQQSATQTRNIDALIDLANRYLGISTSRVLQVVDVRRRWCGHEVFES